MTEVQNLKRQLQYDNCLFYLVEATGIEPVSENSSAKLSPGSAGRLISPRRLHPAKNDAGSPFIRDCYKDELSVHVHR